jgi:hypothetical protein
MVSPWLFSRLIGKSLKRISRSLVSSSRKFEKRLNETFISFIPKKADAYIKYFCPTSFMGGVYKIICKVLASRLKTVLEKIIFRS